MRRITAQTLSRFSTVGNVLALDRTCGCGVAIDVPETEIPIRNIASKRWGQTALQTPAIDIADLSANTTPGNTAGKRSNFVEDAMGSIVNSGSAPTVGVVAPSASTRRAANRAIVRCCLGL